MRYLAEGGCPPVFPKVFKCRNCGIEFAVESFDDMEKNLAFNWLQSPPNPPGLFQFFCPRKCGSGYSSVDLECRQKFHAATFIMYGGEDLTRVTFGTRELVDVDAKLALSMEEALKLAPPEPKKPAGRPAGKLYQFSKRRSKRRGGDSDGTVQSS